MFMKVKPPLIPHLASHLIKNGFCPEGQANEMQAAVSHWLQNPNEQVALLSYGAKLCLLQEFDSMFIRGGILLCSEENSDVESKAYSKDFLDLFKDLPYAPPHKWDFSFIDLFAGIGGFRIAFQKAGGKCVFSSEWDIHAKKTYARNFGEIPYGDIRAIPKEAIPDHDVLCAGFPCQPFSLAGVSKKNALGRKHGFEDETQGTLFFEIKEILRLKRPCAFMLENVKNLFSHDKGNTFEVIRRALEDELGYVINWKIVDGVAWVPQHRERIFIIGFNPQQVNINKEEIIIPEKPKNDYRYPELASIVYSHLPGYTLGPGTWDTLIRHKAYHKSAGHGFGYGLHTLPIKHGEITRTISARYHKDGAEILIEQPGDRPRRLSVQEAMQLQGYDPQQFIFPVSRTQAYKQIGNSVVVPAIEASAHFIADILKSRSK